MSSLSTTLSKVGTVGLAAMGTLATGTVAALAKCTDAAKDFESQMGDVVKYVEGLADADGLISDKLASNGATYAETTRPCRTLFWIKHTNPHDGGGVDTACRRCRTVRQGYQ